MLFGAIFHTHDSRIPTINEINQDAMRIEMINDQIAKYYNSKANNQARPNDKYHILYLYDISNFRVKNYKCLKQKIEQLERESD